MTLFDHLFTNHPADAGESYLEHMSFALRFSWRLLKAAAAAFTHAFVPALCETTASSAVLGIHDELVARQALLARGRAERGEPARGA
jgi:hypothetical protein